MTAIGGPIETVAIAGREFRCTGDSDVNRKFGGFENAIEPNGDGSCRLIKTPTKWMLGGVTVEIDDDAGDQEYLDAVQDAQDFVDVVITYTSGANYNATGQIEGELSYSNSSAAATFDLAGPRKLKKL